MRKTTPTKIGDLLEDYFESRPRIAHKMAEARVTEIWPIVVGINIANQTLSVSVKNGVLTAQMSSSVARQELFMQRNALRDTINRHIGKTVVRAIIVK